MSERKVSKQSLVDRIMTHWEYYSKGIWRDTRNTWRVNAIKTINLSVRSFLDRDLQSQACALTYRTLLAIVPALALLFAIGRGFGFQNIMESQIESYLPSQRMALHAAFGFVDSYLEQASEGIFVGVGIVFLLWTLISLLSSVEDSFNNIWQVPNGRSFWRKMTDYLAIFIVLPVLMICSSGLTLLMSTSLKNLLPTAFAEPATTIIIDGASLVLTWLFFAGSYILIPNTKVKPLNALIAGVVVGTSFQVLQWLFVSGQLYVSKYNAIYGSFSFLPLMLIWLQLTWLITLIGGVLCYASQNIGEFNFGDNIKNISYEYRRQVMIVIMAIIAKRFSQSKSPLTIDEIAIEYKIPVNLVTIAVLRLRDVGLINFIETPDSDLTKHPVQPSCDVSQLSVGQVIRHLQETGDKDFIPQFDTNYSEIIKVTKRVTTAMIKEVDNIPLITLDISPNEIDEQSIINQQN